MKDVNRRLTSSNETASNQTAPEQYDLSQIDPSSIFATTFISMSQHEGKKIEYTL